MPVQVCAICIAKGAVYMNTGYVTIYKGTVYCDQHIPLELKTEAAKRPERTAPEAITPKKKHKRKEVEPDEIEDGAERTDGALF